MKRYSEESCICALNGREISLREFIKALHKGMQYQDCDAVSNLRELITVLHDAVRYCTDIDTHNIRKDIDFTTDILTIKPKYVDHRGKVSFIYDHMKDQPVFEIFINTKKYSITTIADGTQASKCYQLLDLITGLFDHPEFIAITLDYKINSYKRKVENQD